MSRDGVKRCPRCESPIPRSARMGLCRKCLMAGLLEAGPSGWEEENAPDVSGQISRLGDYRLLEEIGRGGMGIIYRAEQLSLRRVVALKVISLTTQWNGNAEQRFQEEAAVVAAMDHPNIIPMYEVGHADGRSFYTMKFIEGQDLGMQIKAGLWTFGLEDAPLALTDSAMRRIHQISRRPGAKTALLMAMLARAVDHAHQRGILHRDLKPSNVLIDRQGRPYVTDFGLAKRLEGDELTLSGELLGTPAYMAPEQAQAHKAQVTLATDVYSLGAILYHLLTGRPPFEGESAFHVIRQVVDAEPVSPRRLNPRVDPDLDTICLKCLEKSPVRRYPTARQLAEDLERWLCYETVLARPASTTQQFRKWVRRHPTTATAAAVIGAAIVSIIALQGVSRQRLTVLAETAQRSAEQEAVLRAEAEAAQDRLSRHLLQLQMSAAEAAFDRGESANGIAQLARIVRERPANLPVARRLIGALSTRNFAQPRGTWSMEEPVDDLALSADGRRLAVVMGDVVQLWDCEREEPLGPPLKHNSSVVLCRLSPNGKWLATGSLNRRVRIWAVPSGQLVRGPFEPSHDSLERHPPSLIRFSAEQSELLVVRDAQLRVHPVDPNAPAQPTMSHDSRVVAVGFDPTGRYTATATFWGYLRVWDSKRKEILFGPEKVPMVATQIAFEPNGERFVMTGDRREAIIRRSATGEVEHNLPHSHIVHRAAWSPDGAWVVTAGGDGRLHFWRADTGFRLAGQAHVGAPVEELGFLGSRGRLWTACADGTGRLWDVETRRPVLEGVRWETAAAACAWGGVAATAHRDRVLLWGLDREQEQEPIQLDHDSSKIQDARFSADGSTVVTVTGNAMLYPWDLRSGELANRTLNPAAHVAAWDLSADGRKIVVVGGDDPIARLRGFPLPNRDVAMNESYILAFAGFVDGDAKFLGIGRNGWTGLWDLSTEKLATEPRHLELGREIDSCVFGPEKRLVLLRGLEGRAAVWAWQSPSETAVVLDTGWKETIVGGEISPDGRHVALFSEAGRATLIDWKSGRRLQQELFEGLRAVSLRFSPDNACLLVITVQGEALLVRRSRPAGFVRLAGTDFLDARFAPNSRELVTTGRDWAVRFWDVATGLPVWEPVWHTSPLYSIAISPDGKRFVTGDFTGASIHRWPRMRMSGPAPEWLPRLAEALVGRRVLSRDQSELVSEAELADVTRYLRDSAEGGMYTAWAQWLLAETREPWPPGL